MRDVGILTGAERPALSHALDPMRRGHDRLLRLRALAGRRGTTELLIAAAVALPTGMDAWWNEEGTRQADELTWALFALAIGALVLRYRWPVGAALGCGAALSGWYLLGHHGELLNLPTMVALYVVAVTGDRRRSIITAVVAAGWSGVLGFTSDDPLGARGGSPMLEMIWPLVPIVWGEAVRNRRELVAHAERERSHEAARRVEAERRRIAREFHDVVAHTMAAVNVQVGVAVAAFEKRPDVAYDALERARASTRDAMDELRASVALLRSGDHDPLSPAPRLAGIDALADIARAASIDVAVRDLGVPECSGAVELAAYRIVQESLTNVVRHSGASHAIVELGTDRSGDLVVEVRDDGRGPVPSSDGSPGFGLAGMAERAGAVGGTIEHGPGGGLDQAEVIGGDIGTACDARARAGPGFRVRAVLPTGGRRR